MAKKKTKYNPNLPKYGYGDWLKTDAGANGMAAGSAAAGIAGGVVDNYNYSREEGPSIGGGAGAGALKGAASGAAMGSLIGPWGTVIGGAVGGIAGGIGGGIKAKKAQEEIISANAAQMRAQKINSAQNAFNNREVQDQGLQHFEDGGSLDGVDEVNYNQLFPQMTSDSANFYITRRTTDTMNNPDFTSFGEDYAAFTNPKLAYDYGNIPGFSMDKNNKISFNASDSRGNTDLFKDIFHNKLSSEDLKLPQLKQKANGGSLGNIGMNQLNDGGLEEYSGQSHQGPQGGIPVGASGSPAVITGEEPTGLVEDGENSWKDPESGEIYIFSDKLKI